MEVEDMAKEVALKGETEKCGISDAMTKVDIQKVYPNKCWRNLQVKEGIR